MIRPERSTPVFVDTTGRRRRRVRRIAYAVGAACLTYTGLVGASVIGHPARPGTLAPLTAPADRPPPAVRQTQPPERPTSGVPLPGGDRPDLEAVPMRLQRRQSDRPPPPPPRVPAPARTESTPLPAPTTPPPAPTEPPVPTEPPPPTQPADPPQPEPTAPPTPEPNDPPAPEPEAPQEPPAGLPVIGPILDLLSGGSARR